MGAPVAAARDDHQSSTLRRPQSTRPSSRQPHVDPGAREPDGKESERREADGDDDRVHGGLPRLADSRRLILPVADGFETEVRLEVGPAIRIERPDYLEADPGGFAAPFGMENVLRWGYVSIDAFGASLGGLPYLGSGDLTIP